MTKSPEYFQLLVLAVYLVFLQNWFSFVYLLCFICLLNLEVEDFYVISQKKAGISAIMRLRLQFYLEIFLIFLSCGILILKIVLISCDFSKESHENFEYFAGDTAKTLLPSIILLITGLISLYFQRKLPRISEARLKNTAKSSKKPLFFKFLIGFFLFFVPITTISAVGLVFLVLFVIFAIIELFGSFSRKSFFEKSLKFFVAAIFCLNYVDTIPGFEFLQPQFLGLNNFSSKNRVNPTIFLKIYSKKEL